MDAISTETQRENAAWTTDENPPGIRRTSAGGMFARRQAERLAREDLVRRARLLPPLPQALLTAYYDRGLTIDELAVLHCMSRQQLYRLLVHWRDVLSDRSFLLAAHFSDRLPARLAQLARGHWIEGRTLRELARHNGLTLHEVRTRLAEARVSLMAAAGRLRETREWEEK